MPEPRSDESPRETTPRKAACVQMSNGTYVLLSTRQISQYNLSITSLLSDQCAVVIVRINNDS